MTESADGLLSRLRDCEDRLLHGDPALADALLAPDFEEVGVDGRRSGREAVLAWLRARDPALRWRLLEVEVLALGEGLGMLRYLARRAGTEGGGSRRVSLWQQGPQGWQLRFHQATRVAQESRPGGQQTPSQGSGALSS